MAWQQMEDPQLAVHHDMALIQAQASGQDEEVELDSEALEAKDGEL